MPLTRCHPTKNTLEAYTSVVIHTGKLNSRVLTAELMLKVFRVNSDIRMLKIRPLKINGAHQHCGIFMDYCSNANKKVTAF